KRRKFPPQTVITSTNLNWAITACKRSIRSNSRMPIPTSFRNLTAHQPHCALENMHRHARCEEGGSYDLTASIPLTVVKSSHYARNAGKSSRNIRQGNTNLQGGVFTVPRQTHDPTLTLNELVIAGPLGIRSRMSICRNRENDEGWIGSAQIL